MKIAIMQPYFLPYLGYFSLINKVDQFIIFDTAQFIRHGWIERNQILKPDGERLYIKVPLKKHSRNTAIKDVEIRTNEKWQDKILSQINPYKKIAPYYEEVLFLLKELFTYETSSIVNLNYYSLKLICRYLGINTPIKIWSSMNLEIEHVNDPDEWALYISKALQADEYYNPIGGLSFFDEKKFKKENISLSFLKIKPEPYLQFTSKFVPFLSIIDVLMFNSKEKVRNMLLQYELVENA